MKDEIFKFDTKVKVSILVGISVVLMYFRVRVPFFPSFLDFDFSDVPILFIGLVFSPIISVIAMGVKNILIVLIMGSFTSGIGELANFLMGSFFVYSCSYVFRKYAKKVWTFLIGMISLIFSGVLMNYFLILPIYMKVLGLNLNEIIGDISVLKYLIVYIVPYNIIKSVIIFFPAMFIYDRFKKINSRNIS